MRSFPDAKLKSIREGFFDRGESIRAWSLARGFEPNLVYHVLTGRSKGTRGKAHRIAVALGLKSLSTPK